MASENPCLLTIGCICIPAIDSALGAICAAVGAGLLSIGYANYDAGTAASISGAGSAVLGVPIAVLALVMCCCSGFSTDNVNPYFAGFLLVADAVFIAVSGAAGYEMVDRGNSDMSYHQALASSAGGFVACMLSSIVGFLAYVSLTKSSQFLADCFSHCCERTAVGSKSSQEMKSVPTVNMETASAQNRV